MTDLDKAVRAGTRAAAAEEDYDTAIEVGIIAALRSLAEPSEACVEAIAAAVYDSADEYMQRKSKPWPKAIELHDKYRTIARAALVTLFKHLLGDPGASS